MTTFFIGDELECYSNYTANVSESTQLSISGFSRGSVYIPEGTGNYVAAPLTDSVTGAPTATNDVLWTHYRAYNNIRYNDNYPGAVWLDNQGVAKVREVRDNYYGGRMQIWNGTAWADTDVKWGDINNVRVWDYRIKIGTQGYIEVYKEGVLVARQDLDTSAIGNIAEFRIYGIANENRFHQLIIADYSTINHTIRRRSPTADGTNKAWVGGFAQVDDDPQATIGTDVIYTSQSGNKATFIGPNMANTTAGHVIKAVAVAEFSKNDGTGQTPQNIRPVLRAGGVDYEGPVNAPIGPGWKGGVAFWENNPATGAAWANIDDVNATEFGVVSKD